MPRARRPQPERRLRERRAGRHGSALGDGDEILVGRYALTSSSRPPAAAHGGGSAALRRAPRPRSGGAARGSIVARHGDRHHRGPLPEGRHREDDDGAHARRRLPAHRPATCSLSTSIPRATSPTTSTSPPDADPTVADVLAGQAKARGRRPRRRAPRQPRPGRVRARAERQDGPRDDAPARAPRGQATLRRDPHRLPAGARPADRQRVVAADYALLSTEAQYFSLQGVEQALEVIELARDNLHPDLEWLGVVLNIADMRTIHSREALAQLASASARRSSRPRSARRSATRSPPSAASRSSTSGPTSATTTSRWPKRSSTGRHGR